MKSRAMRRGNRKVCGLCFVAVAALGCDREGSVESERLPLRVLQVSPYQGEFHVPTNHAVRLRFNRFVDPATVSRQSLQVTPAAADLRDAGRSSAPTYYLEPVYDPYERMVVYRVSSKGRWIPTTWHTMFINRPKDNQDIAGFRAIDGAPLDKAQVVQFMTLRHDQTQSGECDARERAATYCDDGNDEQRYPSVRSVFSRGCAKAGCHVAGHALGLDVSSAQALRETAISVVARQTLHSGWSNGMVSSNPHRLGTDMPRLDPGNPGNSYLVYKLLINEGNYIDKTSSEVSKDCWLGQLAATTSPSKIELESLRNRLVIGQPMPLNGFLTPDQMRAVVRWIMAGAQLPDHCEP